MSEQDKCQICNRDADGMPPCDRYEGHQRPDGYYCDCGHDAKCHKGQLDEQQR